MSRVYVITEKFKKDTEIHVKNRIVGVISKLPNKLLQQFSSYSVEFDDPELLNRIAKEENKKGNVIDRIETKTTNPYKGPINIPCSACSAGDTEMEYHNHEHVREEDRRR